METISIKISKNSLSFISKENESLENFVNSNSVYKQELIYTKKYILNNKVTILKTLNDLVKSNKIEKVIFENNVFAMMFLDIINQINYVKEIVIKEKCSIPTNVYDKLKNNKNLKSIKCYFMPEEFVHTFANRNVSVIFDFKGKFSMKFIKDNDLVNMRNIYYKKKITLDVKTINDFKNFLSINRYLSVIHLYDFSISIIEEIISNLNNFKRDRVVILIHQTEDNLEYLQTNFSKLKKLNKEYSDKDYREIRVVYSKSYVKNNLFKQLTYNNLKLCAVIILYLSFIAIIANSYNDFVTEYNMRLINESLETTETDSVEIVIPNEEIEEVEEEKEIVNPYSNIPTNFESLTAINNDTIGWLSVNNTKINYPVVKTSDNDYYINRDFYKRRTVNGWIFMDYRNNVNNLDKNTIIYGHSLKSGYMFGELYLTSRSSWYKNKDNLVISFNTLDKEMKWQVFSIYRIPNTSDYLKVNFYDNEAFMKFINLISGRSIYNFGIRITEEDKILTLSTCSSGDNRFVVHAKLIN